MENTKKIHASGFLRIVLILIGTVLFFSVLALAIFWLWSRPVRPDGFYAYSDKLPEEKGSLLRVEPYTQNIPAGAKAWRMLYVTSKADGSPGIASGVVVVPDPLPQGPLPVVVWAHGTTGIASGCAPSLLDEPFPAGNGSHILEKVLSEGWAFVVTDYIGLGTDGPHPYLIGTGEAYSVLDSLRAAQNLKGIDLEKEAVIWGHSQGGHSTLWSGILADKYAPELKISGLAALAPASDLPAFFEYSNDTLIEKIISSFVVSAYSSTYSDVNFDTTVRSGAKTITRDIAGRCLSGKKTILSVLEAETLGKNVFFDNPLQGSLGKRIKENVPTELISSPLLIAQGESDELVFAKVQDNYVKNRCLDGQKLEYKTYAGLDHLGLISKDSPLLSDLVEWTKNRQAGLPPKDSC